jgi:hypothetical protein
MNSRGICRATKLKPEQTLNPELCLKGTAIAGPVPPAIIIYEKRFGCIGKAGIGKVVYRLSNSSICDPIVHINIDRQPVSAKRLINDVARMNDAKIKSL